MLPWVQSYEQEFQGHHRLFKRESTSHHLNILLGHFEIIFTFLFLPTFSPPSYFPLSVVRQVLHIQGPGNDFYLGGALVIRKMKFSQFWKFLLYKTSILGGLGPPPPVPRPLFIKVHVTFLFGLQTLQLIDCAKILQLEGLKPKNRGQLNFYECFDLTRKGT